MIALPSFEDIRKNIADNMPAQLDTDSDSVLGPMIDAFALEFYNQQCAMVKAMQLMIPGGLCTDLHGVPLEPNKEYPDTCGNCGSPAYWGLSKVDCKAGCDNPHS